MKHSPVILAIDSSTGPASMAILRGNEILGVTTDPQSQQQSVRMVPAAKTLVEQHVGGFHALDTIAVTTGPGTFTGIRIALAAARGLGLACDCPVFGVSSLATLAWQTLADAPIHTRAISLINAHRHQCYVQCFARTETGLTEMEDATTIDNEQLHHWLSSQGADFIISTHPDFGRYVEAPRAQDAGHLVWNRWQTDGEKAEKAMLPEASYVRPPDAKAQTPFLQTPQS